MEVYNQPWMLIQNQIRSPGGYAMDVFRGRDNPKDIPNGSEAWVGSLTRARGANENCPNFGCAETILPDGTKKYLFEAIAEDPERILGKKHIKQFGDELGMLLKLLDAKNQYFLQAHPTRYTATELWNSPYGKEEAWHVLALRENMAEPPYILLGFKPGVTREQFQNLYYNATLKDLENLCHKFVIQPGETYFVPGGIPHALGAGALVIEIQEPSDLAVIAIPQDELIDFRRKAAPGAVFYPEDNTLYEQRMFKTFVFDGKDSASVLNLTKSKEPVIRSGSWGKELLLIGKEQTEYFSCTKACINGIMPLHDTGEIRIGIVICGAGEIICDSGMLSVKQGDEIFFPYSIPNAKIKGNLELFFANPSGADY